MKSSVVRASLKGQARPFPGREQHRQHGLEDQPNASGAAHCEVQRSAANGVRPQLYAGRTELCPRHLRAERLDGSNGGQVLAK